MGGPIHKVGMPPEHSDTNRNPVPRMNMPMLSDPEVSILMVMIMNNIGLDIITIVLTSTAVFTVNRITMTATMIITTILTRVFCYYSVFPLIIVVISITNILGTVITTSSFTIILTISIITLVSTRVPEVVVFAQ